MKFAKTCETKKYLQEAIDVFLTPNQDTDAIFDAEVTCLLALYGATTRINTLNEFRYKCFIKETTKLKKINLAVLPPSEDAANLHFKRVYYQVQTWLDNKLQAEDWGWKREDTGMIPIFMTQDPAPSELLKMIFCGCKSGCANMCGCRKAGLFCTIACSTCSGTDCLNCQAFFEEEREIDQSELPSSQEIEI